MSKNKMNVEFDSILYTYEGITGHAREEAKYLKKSGHRVFVTDENYMTIFGEEFLDMYQNFDRRENFVTYCVQPPYREHLVNRSLVGHMRKNKLVYFLAFEGDLPKQWVDIINRAPIKLMLVPSTFNKKTFKKNGVKHPIKVLPHGINKNLYFPKQVYLMDDKDFVFTWVGTTHNRRKGLKEMYLAWKKFSDNHKGDENIHLVLKVNKIYGSSEENEKIINRFLEMGNVVLIENGIPDNKMAELFQGTSAYISTSISEGFGMNILQAMACGVPVLSTNWSGNSDFCTSESIIEIAADNDTTTMDGVYGNQEYNKADVNKLVDQMEDVMKNYSQYKKCAMSVSKDILEKYNWDAVGKKLEKYLKDVDTGKTFQ